MTASIEVSIEEGRYYKKLNPAYKFKEYLYKVFYEQENTIFASGGRTFYENKQRVEAADEIIDCMANLISRYQGIPCGRSEHYDKWFEILVVAAYLYSAYHNSNTPILSLVKPRQYTQGFAEEAGVFKGDLEYIFQAIESAENFYGPIKWKAPKDSPGEMFALAVFICKEGDTLFEHAD